MNAKSNIVLLAVVVGGAALAGCAPRNVDFTRIKRPPRAEQLDAYDIFVGSWDWEAEMLNAEGPNKKWTGKASWRWTLDKRCLHGQLSGESGETRYESAGIWSWHPKSRKYIWWMFNDWGYPQQGSASYNAKTRVWIMPYESIGLDGTTSYGRYMMKVKDNDTLEWRMEESVDMAHWFPKIRMEGVYKRVK